MARIIIENLKNITHLDFTLPPTGVYILTGENGSGKTSLLTCLERLKRTYAFRDFNISNSNTIDDFERASVAYEHNGSTLTFRYNRARTRWDGRPWGMNSLISTFGYNDVKFFRAGSASSRLYVQSQTTINSQSFRADYLKEAPDWLIGPMNLIFSTTKYNHLKIRKLANTRGPAARLRKNHILLVEVPGQNNQPHRIYTERNFSMGELFMVNLLYELNSIAQNELLIIDEIELALHPKAQIKLYEHLKTIARSLNLTVILSTHSSTLIRKSKNLLFLEPSFNRTIVHPNYHPALALGSISDETEIIPDRVLCVEDIKATFLIEAMMNLHARINNLTRRPHVPVMPIGGYPQVLEFTRRANGVLINGLVPIIALPDADVLTDTLPVLQRYGGVGNEVLINIQRLTQNQQRLFYLPCTPEIGFGQHFINDVANYENWFRQHYNTPLISFQNVIQGNEFQQTDQNILVEQAAIVQLEQQLAATAQGTPQHEQLSRQVMQRKNKGLIRKQYKKKLDLLVDELEVRTNNNRQTIERELFQYWVNDQYGNGQGRNTMNALIGQIYSC
jgi:ABC-type cobalamin/Fe3+-siderophores transport system ATPase subunit